MFEKAGNVKPAANMTTATTDHQIADGLSFFGRPRFFGLALASFFGLGCGGVERRRFSTAALRLSASSSDILLF